uniref:Glycosyltransferase n=1 Tax=viral metagenome TaxID=1070528 RepID=A0A6C0B1K7_9ZZZZ
MSQNNLVISLTTSPKRLPLLGTTLDSIISQNVKPKQIIVNIPKIFKRTGEEYLDPISIFGDTYKDYVIWNSDCEDDGPITKLQGTLKQIEETEDVWIITIDDDIRYLQYTLELYMTTVLRVGDSKTMAYGLSGFVWDKNRIQAIHEIRPVDVIEGYGSVCYHRSHFRNKSWNSYLKKCLENNDCKFSDDVIISNWLSLIKITRIIVSAPWVNRRLMWSTKCILDHGNESDALHNGGELNDTVTNNTDRYIKVKIFLKEKKLLSNELMH